MTIGRALVEVLVENGDIAYEEQLQIETDKAINNWKSANLKSFNKSCDSTLIDPTG